MFSITSSEMIAIAVIALIIFGPQRLIEMSRRAGRMVAELRRTSSELREGLQQEVDAVTEPFREAGTELAAAGKELRETADGELIWVDVPTEDTDEEGSSSETGAESDATSSDPPSKSPE